MSQTRLLEYLPEIIVPAIFATLRMLFFSILIGTLIGLILGIILVKTANDGLKPNRRVYKILDFIISMLRSFPVIILIVAITPITRAIVGTSIGETAAIVPLTLACAPIIARTIENSLLEVDKNVIIAAKSFGASDNQIIWKVMFPEALPGLVSGMTSLIIICLGTTTVAGAVGAGGLGAIALNYGYQRFDDIMMYAIVIILFVIVITIQGLGKLVYKKISGK